MPAKLATRLSSIDTNFSRLIHGNLAISARLSWVSVTLEKSSDCSLGNNFNPQPALRGHGTRTDRHAGYDPIGVQRGPNDGQTKTFAHVDRIGRVDDNCVRDQRIAQPLPAADESPIEGSLDRSHRDGGDLALAKRFQGGLGNFA